MQNEAKTGNSFSSNLGAILAAVGSAVGLGNIWRFPYICGKYGGGAFLLVYLLFVFLLGMTMMMSEFIIGRRGGHTPSKSMVLLTPKKSGWRYVGHFGVLTTFILLPLYFVISGWTLNYFVDVSTGSLTQLGVDVTMVSNYFTDFMSGVWRPILFLLVFGVITVIIILGGVRKGIESVSKVLMPVLFALLVFMCIYSLTLPGAAKGLEYMFVPDFSKLSGEGVLAALGQALFSLSVGIGILTVYGSYLPKDDNIMKSAAWITLSDSVIAILAGIAIFPAVFSCGMEPAEGAGLVFKVLPVVFNSMGGMGGVVAGLFFLLLVLAALTSAISLLEYICVWVSEKLHYGRSTSALLCIVVTLGIAVMLSLSNGVLNNVRLLGANLFDVADLLSGTYLFPICTLGFAIYFGWVLPAKESQDELSNHGQLPTPHFGVFMFIIKYLVPIAVIIVLAAGIINSL